MAYFPDYGIRENVDSLTACSVLSSVFSQSKYLRLVLSQDLYYCEGFSQGTGSIYVPLFQTVLKIYFYLLHYLFAHLSTEYFIWIRFI